MKKLLFLFLSLCIPLIAFCQSWQSGTQKLYTSPDTTKVGIGITSPAERLHVNNGALKIGSTTSAADRAKNLLKFGDGSYVQMGEWEADDELSFKATKYNFTNGNVGIGVTTPQYKLDVNGKMYLHTVDGSEGWYKSYLQWESHKLIMGVPAGQYAHTLLELIPGGISGDSLFSQIQMYTATGPNTQTPKIVLNTMQHCWFKNTGNIGIGTSNPQYKLDVIGTIRAREILVNTNGADFVFEDNYNLLPLQAVHNYVKENKHLPDIPSAAEMQTDGLAVGEMQTLLLQKIEELTLYIIWQDERIRELENKANNQ